MKPTLFQISTRLGLVLALCAGHVAPLRSEEVDATRQSLEMAANWLNSAMESKAGAGSRKIDVAILPMDVPNYFQFVAAAYGEDASPDLGKPALSAYLQPNTLVDQRRLDTCFLLYNAGARNDLELQFVAPHRKQYGDSLLPFAFVAAHELGHCIEFQHNSPERTRSRSKLQMEVSADIFAILLLKQTGASSHELAAVTASRVNASATHSTGKWIQPALEKDLLLHGEALIEDLWKTADKLSEQAR